MENPSDTVEDNRIYAKGRGTRLVGVLMVLFTCIYFAGALALEAFGEKTIGTLHSDVKDCGSKTCWTDKIEFAAKNGEQITFYPLTFPLLFDLDPWLSNKPYEEYGTFEVRYFEDFPQIAKIKLAFHLEMLGKVTWIFIGLFLMLIGRSSSHPNKPIVIDLSYLRRKI